MSLQQFHSDDSLRTQRMTAEEAKSVIDLWQQERVEQTGLTDKPAVPDVAEGLDIGVEDVQRLLAEVRAQRVAQERALAKELIKAQVAEQERRLVEIERQREELRRGNVYPQRRVRPYHRWMEVKPGVWEDVSQNAPRVTLRMKVGLTVVGLILSTVITLLVCLVWLLHLASH